MIRAGVVGLGVMGKNHARVLNQLENVSLVGLFDPLLAGTDYSGLAVSNSLDEFAELEMDYCVIAVPTALHFESAIKLASFGINCLIEKPLALSSQEASEIEQVFNSHRLLAAVGHIERFNPALMELKRRVNSGQLGKLLQISTSRKSPFPSRISDVGVAKDLASHDVDIVRWLSEKEYQSFSAKTRSLSPNSNEDLLSAICELEDGTLVNHEVNWLSPYKERYTSVLGENGMLRADSLNVELQFFENGNSKSTWQEFELFHGPSEGDSIKYSLARQEPLVSEHLAMHDLLSGVGDGSIASASDGVKVLEVLEKILGSI